VCKCAGVACAASAPPGAGEAARSEIGDSPAASGALDRKLAKSFSYNEAEEELTRSNGSSNDSE
jgi:hypothetical protein